MHNYFQQILDALDVVGGFTTGQIAKKVKPMFGTNNRQHSGAIRSWLIELERKGLVRRLDDKLPTCWIKVAKE